MKVHNVVRGAMKQLRPLSPFGFALSAVLVTMGCSTPIGPAEGAHPEIQASQHASATPVFLRHDPLGPGFASLDTSFVAVGGQDHRIRMFPQGLSDGSDRFLEFELEKGSLSLYPAGHPLAGQTIGTGDTLTISIRIDPTRLQVEFSPSGLVFDPDEPASLDLSYRFADPDFDGDGSPDPQLVPLIGMYHQASPGGPWIRLDAEQDLLDKKIELDELHGFSRYALAF